MNAVVRCTSNALFRRGLLLQLKVACDGTSVQVLGVYCNSWWCESAIGERRGGSGKLELLQRRNSRPGVRSHDATENGATAGTSTHRDRLLGPGPAVLGRVLPLGHFSRLSRSGNKFPSFGAPNGSCRQPLFKSLTLLPEI